MEEREGRVYEALDSLGIPYVRHDHPPAFTVAEAVEHWKGIGGTHCKNLFVRNKPGNRHYLIVAEHLKALDLTALSRKLGDSRLSFASGERLRRHLGLDPGEVSPFGLVYDENHEVIVVLDEDIDQSGVRQFSSQRQHRDADHPRFRPDEIPGLAGATGYDRWPFGMNPGPGVAWKSGSIAAKIGTRRNPHVDIESVQDPRPTQRLGPSSDGRPPSGRPGARGI